MVKDSDGRPPSVGILFLFAGHFSLKGKTMQSTQKKQPPKKKDDDNGE